MNIHHIASIPTHTRYPRSPSDSGACLNTPILNEKLPTKEIRNHDDNKKSEPKIDWRKKPTSVEEFRLHADRVLRGYKYFKKSDRINIPNTTMYLRGDSSIGCYFYQILRITKYSTIYIEVIDNVIHLLSNCSLGVKENGQLTTFIQANIIPFLEDVHGEILDVVYGYFNDGPPEKIETFPFLRDIKSNRLNLVGTWVYMNNFYRRHPTTPTTLSFIVDKLIAIDERELPWRKENIHEDISAEIRVIENEMVDIFFELRTIIPDVYKLSRACVNVGLSEDNLHLVRVRKFLQTNVWDIIVYNTDFPSPHSWSICKEKHIKNKHIQQECLSWQRLGVDIEFVVKLLKTRNDVSGKPLAFI